MDVNGTITFNLFSDASLWVALVLGGGTFLIVTLACVSLCYILEKRRKARLHASVRIKRQTRKPVWSIQLTEEASGQVNEQLMTNDQEDDDINENMEKLRAKFMRKQKKLAIDKAR